MNDILPRRRNARNKASEEHWIPLSDLMTGLMMMFMLIALVFMIKVQAETKHVEQARQRAEAQSVIAEAQTAKMAKIAVLYDDMRTRLYNDLNAEFSKDLERWKADLDRDLTIRFRGPDVLFESQRDEIRREFQEILSNFFPRYLRILSGGGYKDSIEEIRIEGHTSSNWNGAVSKEQAYMLNMVVSQARTRSVLQFILALPRQSDLQSWLISHATANGLSSSHLRLNSDGKENPEASRRVEFRVRTNADSRIEELLKAAGQ